MAIEVATQVATAGNGTRNIIVNIKKGNGSGKGCGKKIAIEVVTECFGRYMNKPYRHILI